MLTNSSILITGGTRSSGQIGRSRVRFGAQKARIFKSIESRSENYQTFVGERGVRLSGGQRQRIDIARAVSKHSSAITFDAATSALGNETKEAVIQAIGRISNDITMPFIAHRRTTLKDRTQIVEVTEQKIKKKGAYQEFVGPIS
jgi:ATP-binding cassette, subfamily B, bacterial PglK